ncbi:MAG: histidinol dehydrogenase [Alicyclobacillaceae bacterium]|nr:histidinol dehydrogenase [Alicyclobacillaceae bacterium]
MNIWDVESFLSRRRHVARFDEERRVVEEMITAVREGGDRAVRAYTKKFDRLDIQDLRMPEAWFEAAEAQVSPELRAVIREAIQNIRRYHEHQRQTSWFISEEDGRFLGQVIRPLRRVGVYVPGGRAAYPSSVLMNVIPAQVAGVKEIAVVTPTPDGQWNPGVLVALRELGVREVYRIGGAQAIAALAYGTETIRPVDKIVGPGNIYVALAKLAVFGQVGIDMMAGPSEILIVADKSANPEWTAADLLSQAEHDPLASAVLVTPSKTLAQGVIKAVERRLARLPRQDIARKSLENNGGILLVDSIEEAIAVANLVAPEHLELMVEDPHRWLGMIESAGAVFLGPWSPEPVGDYFAGPNHVLPTAGAARFASPLSVEDFVTRMSVIHYSEMALRAQAEKIALFARAEGLEAHAQAVEARFQGGGKQRDGAAR